MSWILNPLVDVQPHRMPGVLRPVEHLRLIYVEQTRHGPRRLELLTTADGLEGQEPRTPHYVTAN